MTFLICNNALYKAPPASGENLSKHQPLHVNDGTSHASLCYVTLTNIYRYSAQQDWFIACQPHLLFCVGSKKHDIIHSILTVMFVL